MRPKHAGRRIARLLLWLGALLLWAWAGSVFTPWASDYQPRLWLYDLLFYARYALGAWGLIEAGLCWRAWRDGKMSKSSARWACALLGLGLITALCWTSLHHSEAGWRQRVAWSLPALQPYERPTYADRRHRAGWLIIDTQRTPCEDQAWLWLGRPFGAGSGIGLALVHSGDTVPRTPAIENYRFLPTTDGWWLAYQSRGTHEPPNTDCVAGSVVGSHAEGMRFRGQ